tara:strand:- start:1049 stop:2089 length:1041 start_codon:yes stop_codon:yes gene_type:complete
MKILVTGGCGFIGSNFIIRSLAANNKILNIDKLTYAGNPDNLRLIENPANYKDIICDICDFDLLFQSIMSFKPDAVLHFAAESHVDRSIDSPMEFVNTNILGTTTLLKACQKYLDKSKNDKFRFIHISTDEVYGSLDNKGLFTENTPYAPNSPYSASKASSNHLVRAWYKTYGLPSIITNCSNNYGPYQFPEKLIPLIIANCMDQKPLPVYGDGTNIRDWIFVGDHCSAINKLLIGGDIGETYNIGGNNEIKNIDIVKHICSILDELKPIKNKSYKDLISFVQDRPGHDYRYAMDTSKIMNEIGWIPKETFETGIRKTIQWYLDNEYWWRKIQNENYNQERLGNKK